MSQKIWHIIVQFMSIILSMLDFFESGEGQKEQASSIGMRGYYFKAKEISSIKGGLTLSWETAPPGKGHPGSTFRNPNFVIPMKTENPYQHFMFPDKEVKQSVFSGAPIDRKWIDSSCAGMPSAILFETVSSPSSPAHILMPLVYPIKDIVTHHPIVHLSEEYVSRAVHNSTSQNHTESFWLKESLESTPRNFEEMHLDFGENIALCLKQYTSPLRDLMFLNRASKIMEIIEARLEENEQERREYLKKIPIKRPLKTDKEECKKELKRQKNKMVKQLRFQQKNIYKNQSNIERKIKNIEETRLRISGLGFLIKSAEEEIEYP